jgi:hypothetical protein
MAPELTIVIADVTRKAAIAAGFRIPGRVAHFTNRDLSAALEAVKTHQPRMVAIDALVAQTQQGIGFIKRIESLAMPRCAMVLIVRADGGWRTTPLDPPPDVTPQISIASSKTARPAIVPVSLPVSNTRRAPRFPMLDAIVAAVEGAQASLINISVLGAQVVSLPVLRPGQTVKVALPDVQDTLRLTAHVAWSIFEQNSQGIAVYRAGMSFTDAGQGMLEAFCRNHGGEHALPSY